MYVGKALMACVWGGEGKPPPTTPYMTDSAAQQRGFVYTSGENIKLLIKTTWPSAVR